MARGTAEETETSKGAGSSRFATGTTAMTGDCVATREPAVEQTGQMCEAEGAAVRSVQKWNCAPKKTTPRSNAKIRMRCVFACMYLLRRSLGRNGWGVKETICESRCVVSNQTAYWSVEDDKVKCRQMDLRGTIFGRSMVRRALALLACAALLYFAAGGALFHQHTNGPDTACHICQALHMPALAAARLDLGSTPQIVTWYSSLPQHVAPSNFFSLHRAGRAPPTV